MHLLLRPLSLTGICSALLFWACNSTDPEPRRVLEFELKKTDDQLADSFSVAIYALPRGTEPLKVYDRIARLDSARLSLELDADMPVRFEADVTGFRNGAPLFLKRVLVEANAFVSARNISLDSLPPMDPDNAVPIAAPDTLRMQEDGELLFPASDLVKNDRDGDDDPLRVESVFGALHGEVALVEGNITFTPLPDFFGEAGFEYRVTDGRGGRATTNVIVLVSPVADPPVFAALAAQTIEEGKTLTFTVSATDPDGDSLVYRLDSPPAGAQFDSLTGAFSWKPDFDQQGNYTLTFEVLDSSHPPLSDTLAVEVEVIDFALPEINFSIASASGTEGSPAIVTVALQATSEREIKVRLVSEDSTSSAGQDYVALDTQLVFVPGQFSKAISLQIHDDSLNEADERLRLVLKEPTNATIGVIGIFEYVILDNDPIPDGVWCVDSAAAPGGDGKGWGKAFRNVQDALTAAAAGQEIWVAGGTYTPGNTRTSTFRLKSGVEIYGGFTGGETKRDARDPARRLTVLSGEIGNSGPDDNVYHVVVAWQATAAVLDGFIIRNGNAEGAPQVTGVTGFGAPTGGGVYAAGQGLTLRNCVFSGNRATAGGALSTDGSTVVNCVFDGNTATTDGGAVSGSRWRIYNSVFHDNKAQRGGSLHLQRYQNTWDSASIVHSTFFGNVASGAGGALYAQENAPLEIRGSSMWANQAGTGTQIFFNGNHSQISAWESMVQDRYGNGAVNSENTSNVQWESGIVDIALGGNPGFLSQGNPTGADGLWRTEDDGLQLGGDSPLLDKVTQSPPAAINGVDILGASRIKGAKADIGAYER